MIKFQARNYWSKIIDLSRVNLLICFPYFVLILTFFSLNKIFGFPLLKHSGFPIEVNHDLTLTFIQANCSSSLCPDFVYTIVSKFVFSLYSPARETISLLSWINTILFSITLASFIMDLRTVGHKIMALVVFFSTPFQVLLLTQNIDIFCLLLIFFSTHCKDSSLRILLLSCAASLKYYPLICFLPLLLFRQVYFRDKFKNVIFFATMMVLTLWLIFDYFQNDSLSQMRVGPLNAFGISSFSTWFSLTPNLNLDYRIAILLSFAPYVIFFLLTICIYRSRIPKEILSRYLADLKSSSNSSQDLANRLSSDLSLLCIGLFCYLSTMNWDYRLVYILIPAVRIALMVKSKLFYLTVVGSATFTQYHFEQNQMIGKWAMQFVGDVFLLVLSCILLATVIGFFYNHKGSTLDFLR